MSIFTSNVNNYDERGCFEWNFFMFLYHICTKTGALKGGVDTLN